MIDFGSTNEVISNDIQTKNLQESISVREDIRFRYIKSFVFFGENKSRLRNKIATEASMVPQKHIWCHRDICGATDIPLAPQRPPWCHRF